MKLWEWEHPYYCCEGNHFNRDCYFTANSWDEFINNMGNADDELNLLWRWDWGTDEDTGEPSEYISIFYMVQRKGYNFSYSVKVRKSDNDRILEFLKEKSKKIVEIWEPFICQKLPKNKDE